MDEDFDAEAGAVSNEQHPYPVIGAGLLEADPAGFFAGVRQQAGGAQRGIISRRTILRVAPVEVRHHQHQRAWHQQGDAPAESAFGTEIKDGREYQGHQRLGGAAAGVAPTCGRGVGGANDVGREHHAGVVLGDDEAGANRANQQSKEQEGFVRLRGGDAEHRYRAEQQQAGVGLARPITVAQRTDDQPHQDGHRDHRDVDIGDLVLGQAELALDHRHQRRAGKPSEKADEKRHPGEMEGAHRRAVEITQSDARGLAQIFQFRTPVMCDEGGAAKPQNPPTHSYRKRRPGPRGW